ncbi:MAG TPA: tetratricopeptide repeat protein [Thermoanaerobaculia bacterium]|nr:tetratricopeptide repeat protein [Thermoanaerobaculia bacterium]
MRRLALGAICLFLAAALAAAPGEQILLKARDLAGNPLPGLRFSFDQVKSRKTNPSGITELDLPPQRPPGQQIKINLVSSSKRSEDWFLVNPQINIPTDTDPAEVVLMRRREFRQLAEDAARPAALHAGELTEEVRKQALVDAAARYGLTADQLDTAIRSFAETQDRTDKGIVAYLEGRYPQAEELLSGSIEKDESALVGKLQIQGAAQYMQGKYHASADTFRKAVALRGEDTVLLSWLGSTLRKSAKWPEAESLLRRALAIGEKSLGPEHPDVATHLNNLAQLLEDTNRLAEAEPLMRRALAIDEKSFGPEHPDVGIGLNSLATLLYATNHLAEAEPLMRRALAIFLAFERRTGHEHPFKKTVSGNYRELLKEMGKTDAEIEALVRSVQ